MVLLSLAPAAALRAESSSLLFVQIADTHFGALNHVLRSSPNLKGVITGHFHRDELHWLGEVPIFVAASVAGYWGRQGSYRVYEFRDGKLSYRTQYLEDGR